MGTLQTMMTPMQALLTLRSLATGQVPNCINLAALDRVLATVEDQAPYNELELERDQYKAAYEKLSQLIDASVWPVDEQVENMRFLHAPIIKDILIERVRQLNKFGPQNRPPFEWFLILSEEVGEVAKECVEMQFDDANHPRANPQAYRKELVEVAAVALAALQNFDQRLKPVPSLTQEGGTHV
ncbi:hypothetical protein ACW9KT_15495 [Hymenobacter sp. HD11105]